MRRWFYNAFWRLWLASIKNNLNELTEGTSEGNAKGKKKFQIPIYSVTKTEIIVFHGISIVRIRKTARRIIMTGRFQ